MDIKTIFPNLMDTARMIAPKIMSIGIISRMNLTKSEIIALNLRDKKIVALNLTDTRMICRAFWFEFRLNLGKKLVVVDRTSLRNGSIY